jgi:hypothetical protein
MLMSSLSGKFLHVWMDGEKREYFGRARGLAVLENRAVDLEHGTSTGRSSHSRTKGNHPK